MNKQFWHRNASTILSCLGGVGVVTTAILTAKATPKASRLLDEAKKEKGEKLSKWEKVNVAGKVYIPAVVTGAVTIGCIFGANVLNKRHQASLVSAYAFIDSSYNQYKRKLVELYGEETHHEIMDAIAVEKAKEVGISAPGIVSDNKLYVDEEDCGETRLFYIECGKRYFESTVEQVIAALYHTNRNFVLRGYTTLNELYDFLGLDPTEEGDVLGWTVEDELYWVDYNLRSITIDDDLECIVIETLWDPNPDFLEYYY